MVEVARPEMDVGEAQGRGDRGIHLASYAFLSCVRDYFPTATGLVDLAAVGAETYSDREKKARGDY